MPSRHTSGPIHPSVCKSVFLKLFQTQDHFVEKSLSRTICARALSSSGILLPSDPHPISPDMWMVSLWLELCEQFNWFQYKFISISEKQLSLMYGKTPKQAKVYVVYFQSHFKSHSPIRKAGNLFFFFLFSSCKKSKCWSDMKTTSLSWSTAANLL